MTVVESSYRKVRSALTRMLEWGDAAPRNRATVKWIILVSFLGVWLLGQCFLVWGPLSTRSSLPEPDDSLAYLVRAQALRECPARDCPALDDLRRQLRIDPSDPRVAKQQELGHFGFPIYHPLFSALLVAITKFGPSLEDAYRLVWRFAPIFFGLAFASLLISIWGAGGAGFALGLLAGRVFPDQGLHYAAPSSLSLGLAAFLWARLISKEGNAPVSLFLGSVAMMLTHPVGVLCAMLGAVFVLTLFDGTARKSAKISACAVLLTPVAVLGAAAILLDVNPLAGVASPAFDRLAETAGLAVLNIQVQYQRLSEGLFGTPSIFLLGLVFGLIVTPRESRRVAVGVGGLYLIMLAATIPLSGSLMETGAVFLRMSVLLFVLAYGFIGMAHWSVAVLCLRLWKDHLSGRFVRTGGDRARIEALWPVLLFAVFTGYAWNGMVIGVEQLEATRDYMTKRQPLRFDPEQPKALLAEARPGDRVLYTARVPMQYYFVHGAMRLGAVNYHPLFERSPGTRKGLAFDEVRFVVAYNPLIHHPLFEGLEEKDRGISLPDYRFSPLSTRRAARPILKEGVIRAAEFAWIEIAPQGLSGVRALTVLIDNPGGSEILRLVPLDEEGGVVKGAIACQEIEKKKSAAVTFHDVPDAAAYRLLIDNPTVEYEIAGVFFGARTGLSWPWRSKATLRLVYRAPPRIEAEVSFDPLSIVPPALRSEEISVQNDDGSSVLLQVGLSDCKGAEGGGREKSRIPGG